MSNVVSRMLDVPKTDEELVEEFQQISEKLDQVKYMEDQKKELPEKIKVLYLEIHQLNSDYKESTKTISVDCEWQYDHPAPGVKSLIRLDTNETIDESEMSLFDISENESVFNLLRSGFQSEDETYIESDFESVSNVLCEIIEPGQAEAVTNALYEQFLIKSSKKILIEKNNYPLAKQIIKDILTPPSAVPEEESIVQSDQPPNGPAIDEELLQEGEYTVPVEEEEGQYKEAVAEFNRRVEEAEEE